MSDSYARLLARSREIALLGSAAHLLHWDAETLQPKAGVAFRAEQFAYFGGATHRLFTAPEVGGWISDCEAAGYAPDSTEAANVRGWRREYDRATRLPQELVEAHERSKGLAREAWIEARRRSDFAHFQPHLEILFGQAREMADHWGWQGSRYNALLDAYEPGADVAQIRAIFDAFRPQLREILPAALAKSAAAPRLEGEFPVEGQIKFNAEVARAVGFDFEAGRIDASTHPFCSRIAPGDTRLTTRYDIHHFASSLFSVLHEAGHGMYEQGVPEGDAYGTPMGSAVSLGIHESQSRLWENLVGRAPEFWEHWFPRAAEHLPALRRYTPAEVCASVNRVEPSFIRVEADQVTYDFHIMLRFEIERRLLDGELALADVPAVWNEEFERSLGLKVPDDAHGCLQDIHWSAGLIGYFPTYTLGNLNAAQLFARARAEEPAIDAELARGDYARLLGWMRRKIHARGSALLPMDLMREATGAPTGVEAQVALLRAKFGLAAS
ncbi:MAG: carboxypeptidase M32 [Verrucomicrobia bacterium]|nr:carboxypeptidase M32 [Verrucomicrobiota bacterium]